MKLITENATQAASEKKMKQLEMQRMQHMSGWLVIFIASLISFVMLLSAVLTALSSTKQVNAEPLEEPITVAASTNETRMAAAGAKKAEESATEPTKESPEVEAEAPQEVTWHFYNLDLQNNGDAKDDYNFGPNPILANISLENVKNLVQSRGINGTVKVKEILEGADVSATEADFKERLRNDPALGAADMAWLDSIVGTRYLGVFYDECDEKWDATMNKAKEEWSKDPDAYNKTLDAFFEYLDKATKREIKYVDKGLNDQMYMNPFTVDKVPDIIVMETTDHDGWFLTYEFTIKETTKKEVMYRLNCGYQPTNVAEVMKITPQKSKVGGSSSSSSSTAGNVTGGKSTSGGSGGSAATNPTNQTTPSKSDPKKPKYNKDPTKGTPVLPNDDKGPGENTNNPADPFHSTKDQPTNSNHLTPTQYQEAIHDLQDANNTSRSGGESNTPTTTTPSDTAVDSNANSGTGNGGIDHPTEVHGGTVADDSAGVAWDGPSD